MWEKSYLCSKFDQTAKDETNSDTASTLPRPTGHHL